MSALLRTYDECIKDPDVCRGEKPLIPIFHTINNTHITVTLDSEGTFVTGSVVPKDDQPTIMPCTEKSSNRTSAFAAYPLADKLIYLSDEYYEYSDNKRGKINPSTLYKEQLQKWADFDPSNGKLQSIFKYIRKGRLVKDLISVGIIVLNDSGKCASKDEAPEAPLFTIGKVQKDQLDAFVRWSVDDGSTCPDAWEDQKLWDSWSRFILSVEKNTGLCYLSGQLEPLADLHPSKIRNSGDKAKIISSNDSSGYTYRGRFIEPNQVCGIGSITTQKVHNALSWLIRKQGYLQDTLCIVSWTTTADNFDILESQYDVFGVDPDHSWTNEQAARHLNDAIRGYNSKILQKDVYLLILDSAASNQGRLSIVTFRTNLGEDLVNRLEEWHSRCAWRHEYGIRYVEDKPVKVVFLGAPIPRDIAKACYGERVDDKVIVNTIKRLLPCILDGAKIPYDVVETLVRRASNPMALDSNNFREWRKALSIACSIYKGYYGGYEMSLEEDRRTRDYLYGRLLALADLAESSALRKAGESRPTNAKRMMQRFSEYPYVTWLNIELSLSPYLDRLGPGLANYYVNQISNVMEMFDGDDFRDNSKLSGEFLLAYHCQCNKVYNGSNKEGDE
jgi:CRISPR-associated protein Csd1